MNLLNGEHMNTFAQSIVDRLSRTENDMAARATTASACVDLFYKIGASRGKNIVPDFVSAFVQDQNRALRIAQWARDVRGGAGERQLFRDILRYLEIHEPGAAVALAMKVPEIGRFDDLFVFNTPPLQQVGFKIVADALNNKNGLAAKWTPRKGPVALEFRNYLGWSPKRYRKTLVELTKVVETQMCSNDWDNINFSQVPSLAATRYKKAFNRHTPKFAEYVNALTKGDPSVKVNAGAVYPYDVLRGVIQEIDFYDYDEHRSKTELDFVIAQWNALENFVGDANILPLVDVSGSMTCRVHNSSTTCLEVAVSLGLYLSEKNTGKFKDLFVTFAQNPEFVHLQGNIVQRCHQMARSNWSMNTDLIAALKLILNTAVRGSVPQNEMPEVLLILSDMQFDQCVEYDDSALESIKRNFTEKGYEVPKVVFWNLNSHGNVPVRFDASDTALVSGFSPSIVRSILGGKTNFTPQSIMDETIMNPRYDVT